MGLEKILGFYLINMLVNKYIKILFIFIHLLFLIVLYLIVLFLNMKQKFILIYKF